MDVIRRLLSVASIALIGVIALYAFFVALGAFAPGEVWALTIAVGVVTVLVALHLWNVRREVSREGPNPARRKLNALRERRGF